VLRVNQDWLPQNDLSTGDIVIMTTSDSPADGDVVVALTRVDRQLGADSLWRSGCRGYRPTVGGLSLSNGVTSGPFGTSTLGKVVLVVRRDRPHRDGDSPWAREDSPKLDAVWEQLMLLSEQSSTVRGAEEVRLIA
jgi:hypothetical protein